jgi:hypothetical protein
MSREPWDRDADGRTVVGAALAALPSERWVVLPDVRWPEGRHANIDQIVVGPGGVFVIDSRSWRGGRPAESALVATVEASLAVSMVVPSVPIRNVQPVLCLVHAEPISERVRDVAVCSTLTLVQMLLTRPMVLDDTQVKHAAMGLELALRQVPTPHPERGELPRPRDAKDWSKRPVRSHRASRVARAGPRTKVVLTAGVLLLLLGVTSVLAPGLGQLFTP